MRSELDAIPDGWRWERVGDLCECVSVGYVSSTRAFFCRPGEGVPLVRSQNIRPGRLVLDSIAWVTRAFHEANPKSQLQPGDVLITRVGANAGDVCIVPDGLGALHLSSAVFARPLAGHRKYIELFFRSPLGQHLLKTRIVGSVSERINTRDVESLSVLLPPPKEEAAITHILGTLDDKIELNRCMNKTLEGMTRALFRSWFVDFDPVRAKAEGRNSDLPKEIGNLFPNRLMDSEMGEIPEGWGVANIGELAEVIDCLHSKKPARQKEGLPLLQLYNIRDDGLIDMQDTYFINETDYHKWVTRMEASTGDCVITNVGRVGAVAQMPADQKAALGRNMTGVRCKRTFPFPTFLLECLLSQGMRDEITLNMDTGTILDALNVRNIPKLRLVRSPEQLLERFEKVARPLRAQMERHAFQSHTLGALRDTLLPKLISGELKISAP